MGEVQGGSARVRPPLNRTPPAGARRPTVDDDSELTSIGSPKAVPVPCVSKHRTPAGCITASSKAATSTACCDGPLGAMNDALLPSWSIEMHSLALVSALLPSWSVKVLPSLGHFTFVLLVCKSVLFIL